MILAYYCKSKTMDDRHGADARPHRVVGLGSVECCFCGKRTDISPNVMAAIREAGRRPPEKA